MMSFVCHWILLSDVDNRFIPGSNTMIIMGTNLSASRRRCAKNKNMHSILTESIQMLGKKYEIEFSPHVFFTSSIL